MLDDERNLKYSRKHESLVLSLACLFNNEKRNKKYKYLRLVKDAGFSLKETKALGFKTSYKLWKSDLTKDRNPGGRPKLEKNFISEIKNYFLNNSLFASNRFLKLQEKNAMFRQTTFRNAFNSLSSKKDFSFSSFYKYTPRFVKKPQRITDLCNYCFHLKVGTEIILREMIFTAKSPSVRQRDRPIIDPSLHHPVPGGS